MCSALTSASLDFPLICIVSAIHAMHSFLLPIPALAHKVNCVNYSNPFARNQTFSVPYLEAIRLWLTEHSSIQLYAVGSVLCMCSSVGSLYVLSPCSCSFSAFRRWMQQSFHMRKRQSQIENMDEKVNGEKRKRQLAEVLGENQSESGTGHPN